MKTAEKIIQDGQYTDDAMAVNAEVLVTLLPMFKTFHSFDLDLHVMAQIAKQGIDDLRTKSQTTECFSTGPHIFMMCLLPMFTLYNLWGVDLDDVVKITKDAIDDLEKAVALKGQATTEDDALC